MTSIPIAPPVGGVGYVYEASSMISLRDLLERLSPDADPFVFPQRFCVCCGSVADLTIDHIVARWDGGSDLFDNLQTLCGQCNSRKATRRIDFMRDPVSLNILCPFRNNNRQSLALGSVEWAGLILHERLCEQYLIPQRHRMTIARIVDHRCLRRISTALPK